MSRHCTAGGFSPCCQLILLPETCVPLADGGISSSVCACCAQGVNLADVSCRGSVRLYSDFYESDIIVASPLALATKLSEDEEEGEQHWHLRYACPGLAFRRCPLLCKFPQRVTVTIVCQLPCAATSARMLAPRCLLVCWPLCMHAHARLPQA